MMRPMAGGRQALYSSFRDANKAFDYVQWLHNNSSMPTIHRLPSCKIELRTRDHRPAHVHVIFGDGREVLVYLLTRRNKE
jgi:hypothetical protein